MVKQHAADEGDVHRLLMVSGTSYEKKKKKHIKIQSKKNKQKSVMRPSSLGC